MDGVPDPKSKVAAPLEAALQSSHVLHGRMVVLDFPPLGRTEEEVHDHEEEG